MKKLILLVACAIFAVGASAQVQFGAKAGLNLASQTNADVDSNGNLKSSKMKPSFYLGGFAEYTISDFVGVQGELIYSRQGGFTKETEAVFGTTKTWTRLDYLNIPILAKIYVLENLSIDLGPQFGFLVSAKGKWETTGADDPDDNGSETVDIKKITNGFDMSFGMGVSYKITPNIEVGARYNLGLTDTVKDNPTKDKEKNNVIQVGVGYRF